MTGDGRFVVAIVRGDYEVNETKLVNAVKATGGLRPAHGRGDRGARDGGRLRLADRRPDTVVVVDELVARSPNLVAGANRVGWHVRNVNVPPRLHAGRRRRDHERPGGRRLPDLRLAGRRSARASRSATSSSSGRTSPMPSGATYLGEDGERHPIVMGSYGIGVGRNVACIVEAHHDEKGIVWPAEVAPYAAHLVAIGAAKDPRVTEVAERLHDVAERRPGARSCTTTATSRPGVKFTDAELLGMPWILTVSPRSLAAGGVEVTERATGERVDAPDRGGRGAAQSWLRSSGTSFARASRTSASCSWLRLVPSSEMTASPVSASSSTSASDETVVAGHDLLMRRRPADRERDARAGSRP